MAQYFTDFSGDTVGLAPADTEAKRASVAGDYTVVTAGSEKNLSYSPSSGGTTARGLAYSLAPSSGQTEILVRFEDPSSSPASARAVLFASDGPDNEYGALIQKTSEELLIYRRVAGSYSERGSSYNNGFRASEKFLLRFQVTPDASGNLLKASAWIGLLADEPASWQIEISDSELNILASTGWSGHVGFDDDTDVRYLQVGIGTNGDAAPTSAVATGPDTPINPSITDLLATSARLNWEQG